MINFIPSRIFRGPLLLKPITVQDFFAVSYSKPDLENLNFEVAINKITIIEKLGKSKNVNFPPSKSFFKLKIRLNLFFCKN